jgi:hypothetical protein
VRRVVPLGPGGGAVAIALWAAMCVGVAACAASSPDWQRSQVLPARSPRQVMEVAAQVLALYEPLAGTALGHRVETRGRWYSVDGIPVPALASRRPYLTNDGGLIYVVYVAELVDCDGSMCLKLGAVARVPGYPVNRRLMSGDPDMPEWVDREVEGLEQAIEQRLLGVAANGEEE